MIWKILLIYLLAVNVLGAGAVFIDKWLAKHEKRRIRERTLFLWCIFGGCPLVYGAMKLCRHKTRKKRFMIGVPLIFIAQIALVCVVVYYLHRADMLGVTFVVTP